MLDYVKSRVDPLIPLCKDKTVLNLGGVGMGVNDTFDVKTGSVGKDFHLPRVKAIAKELVVVDIQQDKLDILQKQGYNTVCQSADEPFQIYEDTTTGIFVGKPLLQKNNPTCKKFNVVIAEELIEHLQNLSQFFSNVRSHLKEDVTFIITSPNPFAWSYMLQNVFMGIEQTNNAHTCWFSRKTMKYLLEQNGFEVVSIRTIDAESENLRGRIAQNLLRWLPKRFGINVIYQARLKNESK